MRYFKTYVRGELMFLESTNSYEMVKDRAETFCSYDENNEYKIEEISKEEANELFLYMNNSNKEFIGNMPKLL
jgi:hypothetical protein